MSLYYFGYIKILFSVCSYSYLISELSWHFISNFKLKVIFLNMASFFRFLFFLLDFLEALIFLFLPFLTHLLNFFCFKSFKWIWVVSGRLLNIFRALNCGIYYLTILLWRWIFWVYNELFLLHVFCFYLVSLLLLFL